MRTLRRVLALMLAAYLTLGPNAGRALAALDAETKTDPGNSGKTPSGAGTMASGLESFKTDLATGAASFSVPIEVPPGTAGMQPALALSYSSGAGSGWVGFGWTLDLGRISRRTQRGVPQYDASDEFQLDQTRLVVGADGLYHTEIESFLRVEHKTSGGDWWEVTSKDGKKLYFGTSPNSRIASGSNIFAWLLDKVEDNFKNQLSVTYQTGGDDPNRYPREIIYTYHDAAPENGGLVGGAASERKVEFCLEGDTDACEQATLSSRHDPIVSYQSGFRLQTTHRLKSVRTYFNGGLVRRYNLNYLDPSGASARSRLASVQVVGSDGATAAPAMTFTYTPGATGYGTAQGWDNPSDSGSGSHFFSMRTQTSGGESLSTVMDLDGDGVADRVTVDDDAYWRVWRVMPGGGGYEENSTPWAYRSGTIASSYETQNLRDTIGGDVKSEVIDLDGDALPDRVTRNKDNDVSWNVYWNDRTQFTTQPNGDPWPWPNPSYDPGIKKYNSVRHTNSLGTKVTADVIDMTGDGLPDRVVEDPNDDSNWKVYKNLGRPAGFSTSFINWNNRSPQNLTSIQNRTPNGVETDVIDLNGDGLPDRVVAVHNDRYWHVWFGTGSGFENVERLWDNPSFLYESNYWLIRTLSGDKFRAELEDVNGDGLVDRITEGTASGTFDVYLNTGAGFSTTILPWTNLSSNIEPRQTQGNSTIADLADVNGDGLTDRVVYTGVDGEWEVCPYPAPKPDLLRRIENGLGGSVEIEYKASSQYLDAAGTARLNDQLPFPVQTVSKVTRRDGVDDAHDVVTTYTYQGGFYEPVSREFRGFAEVTSEVGDPDDPLEPNKTRTVTYFKPEDDALKGQVDGVEVYALNGETSTLLTQVHNEFLDEYDPDWAEVTSHGGAAVQVALVKRTLATVFGVNPEDTVTTGASFLYDEFGNVVEQVEEGLTPLPPAPYSADGDERKTCTTYAPVTDSYRAGFPVTVSRLDGDVPCGTQELSRTTFEYAQTEDVDGFWVTRKDWLKDDLHGIDKDVLTQRTRDPYGNVKDVTDANNHTATVHYDGEPECPTAATSTHTFPCLSLNALGHARAFAFDAGLGKLTEQIDANLHATRRRYDALGRLTQVRFEESGKPEVLLREVTYPALAGGTEEGGTWGELFGDPEALSPQNIRTIDYAAASASPGRNDGIEGRVYFDGLGRPVATRADGDDQQAVVQESTYDARGRVHTTSLPHFSGAASPGVTTRQYDPLGRLVSLRHPNGSCTTFAYDPLETTTELRETDCAGTVRQKRVTRRDAYGNVVEVEEYESVTGDPFKTKYFYDKLDNLTRVEDACETATAPGCNAGQQHVTEFTYDTLSRKVRSDDPAMGQWTYEYDDVGNLVEQIDAKNNKIGFTYDELDRVDTKDYYTFNHLYITFTVDFTYDERVNGTGRLTAVTDRAGTVYYDYDARGNLVHFIRDFQPANKRYEYFYTYDDLGRVTETQYPKNQSGQVSATLSYDYTDGTHQTPFVQAITFNAGKPGEKDIVLPGTVYDAFGNLKEFVDGAGSHSGFAYDSKTGQMTSNYVTGATIWMDDYYEYDPATLNITKVGHYWQTRINQEFPEYDGLGRLKKAVGPWLPDSTSAEASYEYDALGNMTKKDDIASYPDVSKALFYEDPTNPHAVTRLEIGNPAATTRTYTYDDNGNMESRTTGSSVTTYVWDEDNRLIRVQNGGGGGTRYFTYDYTGERVRSQWESGSSYLFMPTRDFEYINPWVNLYVFLGSVRVASLAVSFTPPDVPVGGGWINWEPLGRAAGSAAAGLWPLWLTLLLMSLGRWWIHPRRAPVRLLAYRAGIGFLVVTFLAATNRPANAIGPPYPGHWGISIYYYSDFKGSTTKVIDDQQNGQQGLDYWPYGATRANMHAPTVDVRHKFTGQERDDRFDLYYYGGRWYDPQIGRFISPDPLVPAPRNPQSLNRYSYVLNNPTDLIDPSGYSIAGDFITRAIWVHANYEGTKAAINGDNFLGDYYSAFGRTLLKDYARLAIFVGSSLVAAPVGGYIGGAISALGGFIGSAAAAGFVSGGLNSLLGGGNFLQGGVRGAVWAVGTSIALAAATIVVTKIGGLVSSAIAGSQDEDLPRQYFAEPQEAKTPEAETIERVYGALERGEREVPLQDIFNDPDLAPRGNVHFTNVINSDGTFSGDFSNVAAPLTKPVYGGLGQVSFAETLKGSFTINKSSFLEMRNIEGFGVKKIMRGFKPKTYIKITPDSLTYK